MSIINLNQMNFHDRYFSFFDTQLLMFIVFISFDILYTRY